MAMHQRRTQRAVQYVRMSTERQDYSIDFQMATNTAYAIEHGLEIIRTYEDAGISGLGLEKRAGLKKLLAEVVTGETDFATILVYDVSRWGRFQNPDQAAHYEFICSEAGVHVAYCAEPFENDGSPASALLKHLKRAMAAEYSRDLSQKVSRAQRGLLAEGYWIGGKVPFGFRRVFTFRGGPAVPAVTDALMRKQQGVRTRLVLGPDAEVSLVRRIFRMYLQSRGTFSTVSRALARDKRVRETMGFWSPKRVADTLRNEVYVGRLIGGRRIKGVGETWGVPAPREQWIVAEDAVPPIVSEATFQSVRRKRLRRAGPITREAALADVRRVAAEHGDISQRLLRLHGRYSAGVYGRIFGSIGELRILLDMPLPQRYAFLHAHLRASNKMREDHGLTYTMEALTTRLRSALAEHGYLSEQLLNSFGKPGSSTYRRRFGSIPAAYKAVGYQPSERQLRAMASAAKRRPETFR